jgi:hypothetical protein
MRWFKLFDIAAATLDGIELHHMIKKRQSTTEHISIHEKFYALAA